MLLLNISRTSRVTRKTHRISSDIPCRIGPSPSSKLRLRNTFRIGDISVIRQSISTSTSITNITRIVLCRAYKCRAPVDNSFTTCFWFNSTSSSEGERSSSTFVEHSFSVRKSFAGLSTFAAPAVLRKRRILGANMIKLERISGSHIPNQI